MTEASSSSPSVLLITTDHWPGHLLGVAGHPCVSTPTLDSLAASGVWYPNAYAECPVCVPARRTLMSGLTPRGHGMRDNASKPHGEPPVWLAQAFRDAGYQAYAVGKIHTKPQRSRIGFDDILLDEEGRCDPDDYEIFLRDRGHAGRRFAGGMSNNEYVWRPWHLPEDCHVTNWAAEQMCRAILRRDPSRPAFWYLAFSHPHPPLTPLNDYLDFYRERPMEDPVNGDWVEGAKGLSERKRIEIAGIRRAFYAQCTHIDHQIRVVIGTLRSAGVLDSTIILFSSDHGDMLGDHGLWAKRVFFEGSANIPMILSVPEALARTGCGVVDERLVGWADVMPTLLDLCGVEVPAHCEGLSMVGEKRRDYLYGECGDAGKVHTSRMIRRGDYKLVYYPHGNRRLLFNMADDRRELRDLSGDARHGETLAELTALLAEELEKSDPKCVEDGKLIGLPELEPSPKGGYGKRGLSAQRGYRWA